jgi:sugar phosphate isomerase/epimerase
MIFVSTGGIKDTTAYHTGLTFIEHGITGIELSGGAYEEIILSKYQKLLELASFQVHNYFPPPKNPFVFNLASVNHQIAEKSISLAKNAIKLSAALQRPIYSFHAGFLLDPKVSELGKRIDAPHINDRNVCMELFLERIANLAEYASSNNVQLLIENNVISDSNIKRFGEDPLLMTTPKEAKFIMENTPSNVNMLLDVAHLKVSANSLGFDRRDMFSACDDWIKAYHFSDNDGKSDSNKSIGAASWFWPHVKKNENYYTLEIYNSGINELKEQVNITNDELCS